MYNISVIVSAGGHTPENNARTHVSVELESINNNDFFSSFNCPKIIKWNMYLMQAFYTP